MKIEELEKEVGELEKQIILDIQNGETLKTDEVTHKAFINILEFEKSQAKLSQAQEDKKKILEIIDNCPTTYHKDYSTGLQSSTIEIKELKKKIQEEM